MQLELFAAKTCLCLLGDQGQPENHGECAWVCTTCMDTFTCDACRADLIIGDREPTWSASLRRWVVTRYALYGLLDGRG